MPDASTKRIPPTPGSDMPTRAYQHFMTFFLSCFLIGLVQLLRIGLFVAVASQPWPRKSLSHPALQSLPMSLNKLVGIMCPWNFLWPDCSARLAPPDREVSKPDARISSAPTAATAKIDERARMYQSSSRRFLLTDQSCSAPLGRKASRFGAPRDSSLPAATIRVDEPTSEFYKSPCFLLAHRSASAALSVSPGRNLLVSGSSLEGVPSKATTSVQSNRAY